MLHWTPKHNEKNYSLLDNCMPNTVNGILISTTWAVCSSCKYDNMYSVCIIKRTYIQWTLLNYIALEAGAAAEGGRKGSTLKSWGLSPLF